MTNATLTTEPFSCPSCVAKIESTLNALDGVDQARVLFHSNKVKVGFDDTVVSAESLADTVTKLGYPVTKVSVS